MEKLCADPTVPFRERISCTVAEACAATGLGRTKLYMLIDEGVLASVTVGRRRLIVVDSLLAILKPRAPKTGVPS
ncbi:MAG: excisionase family DNA-binding protein [Alphaproteobacteria bacterium]|nr:excisionase family DNA-binding protein [Alphaproteobacteria bacterium]